MNESELKKGMKLYRVEWMDKEKEIFQVPIVNEYELTVLGTQMAGVVRLYRNGNRSLVMRACRAGIARRHEATPQAAIEAAQKRAKQDRSEAIHAQGHAESRLRALDKLANPPPPAKKEPEPAGEYCTTCGTCHDRGGCLGPG